MGSEVAKAALLGKEVKIVNCEKIFMTGNRDNLFANFERKRKLGTWAKGPFYPRMPDRLVKRLIRGMLPIKTARGREALKRIMCYVSVPSEFKNEKLETIKHADVSRLSTNKYTSIEEISRHIGAKI
jgi:large subunit ribosomal protein L13